MKQKFSKTWKASKRPGKQRKYAANAPLHVRRKMMSANLSKELRKKYGKRNLPLRKWDTVSIMRGKFKKKQGKIIRINSQYEKIYIEKVQVKKKDGSNVDVPVRASNLQIIELNLDDKKRVKTVKLEKSEKKE